VHNRSQLHPIIIYSSLVVMNTVVVIQVMVMIMVNYGS
jgi:hypothetical protein